MTSQKKTAKAKTENEVKEPAVKAKMTTVSLRNIKAVEQNPFINDVIVRTRAKKISVSRGTSLIDQSTGEIEGRTEICQIIDVDREEFVKIYTGQMRSFFDLSLAGYKTLQLVFMVCQQHPQAAEIHINPNFNLLTDGVSKEIAQTNIKTLYKGLAELIAMKFLAKSTRGAGWYWINPSLFFNGDRVRFVKEYRVKEDARQGQLFEESETGNQPIGESNGQA